MSPTIFWPGASAVKSRFTRSGMLCSWPSPSVRLNRHGRGWQGSKPSSRMTDRTISGPAGTPQAARSAWTRRYPYVSSESSKDFFTYSASIPAFSLSLIPGHPASHRILTGTLPSTGTFSRSMARAYHLIPGRPHTPRR